MTIRRELYRAIGVFCYEPMVCCDEKKEASLCGCGLRRTFAKPPLRDLEVIAIADYLKEDFGQIWLKATKAIAARFLTASCRRARAFGFKVFITMANNLKGHRNGILNWYD